MLQTSIDRFSLHKLPVAKTRRLPRSPLSDLQRTVTYGRRFDMVSRDFSRSPKIDTFSECFDKITSSARHYDYFKWWPLRGVRIFRGVSPAGVRTARRFAPRQASLRSLASYKNCRLDSINSFSCFSTDSTQPSVRLLFLSLVASSRLRRARSVRCEDVSERAKQEKLCDIVSVATNAVQNGNFGFRRASGA